MQSQLHGDPFFRFLSQSHVEKTALIREGLYFSYMLSVKNSVLAIINMAKTITVYFRQIINGSLY